MNSWSVIGRLGRDPVLRRVHSGDAVLNMSVAVDGPAQKDQGGQWKPRTLWVDVTIFGRRAEQLDKLSLKKGQRISATGELNVREYEGRGGEHRQQLELLARVCDPVDFGDRQQQQPAQRQNGGAREHRDDFREDRRPAAAQHYTPPDDDVPF